ncbi:hypothetical protein B0H13DRAFT_2362909 [Mycena leptocephala]|nr:hypothetical protein B0H13DRAFT_2362909 [Mycena leptocephala]
MSPHPLSTPHSASSAENMPQTSSRSHFGTDPHVASSNGAGTSIPRNIPSGNVASLNSENHSETSNYAVPISKTRVPVSAFVPYTPLPPLHVNVPINATPSDDILESPLPPPILSRNVFTAEASELVKIVKSHHIPVTATLTVRVLRHVYHLNIRPTNAILSALVPVVYLNSHK